jgi:hypothetical protein
VERLCSVSTEGLDPPPKTSSDEPVLVGLWAVAANAELRPFAAARDCRRSPSQRCRHAGEAANHAPRPSALPRGVPEPAQHRDPCCPAPAGSKTGGGPSSRVCASRFHLPGVASTNRAGQVGSSGFLGRSALPHVRDYSTTRERRDRSAGCAKATTAAAARYSTSSTTPPIIMSRLPVAATGRNT